MAVVRAPISILPLASQEEEASLMMAVICSHIVNLLLFSFLVLSPGAFFAAGVITDTFGKGQNVTDGKTLVSAGGTFTMGFFSPGTSAKRYLGIWFSVSSDAVCWVANRDRPLNDTSGVLVVAGETGDLLLLDGSGQVAWSSDSPNTSFAEAQLLESGNLVLHDQRSKTNILWQSFDHPSDTLLPLMKMGKNLWTGAEWYLTSWRSPDDPSPGDYRRVLDTGRLPEIVLWQRDAKTYRTGPWNGLWFNGVPEASTYGSYFPLHVTASSSELTYGYTAKPGAPFTRVVVTDAGVVRRLVWDANTRAWQTFFQGPRDVCDAYGKCGAFGLCDASAASAAFCSCLKGFSPASPSAWYMRETSGGCRRNVALNCGRNGTASTTDDGFELVRGVKLPDTHNATVDTSISVEECRARCIANCSCLAYAAADIRGGGGGSGCIVWTDAMVDLRYVDQGQDLYLRLAGSELGEAQHSPSRIVLVIIGASIASLVVVLLVLGLVTIVIRRRRQGRRISVDNGQRVANFTGADSCRNHASSVRSVPEVGLPTIKEATGNFSKRNIIGQGAFGEVYEGHLPDGRKVAVKRLKQTRLTENSKENFTREVELMSRLTHCNLAKLLYYCQEGDEWILVYEYMQRKSLNLYIFGGNAELRSMLNWVQRLDIIRGIAIGVEYLHGQLVIHRDLKPDNILLDDTWKAKLADFATAKLFIDDQTNPTLVLTTGYIAPEYAVPPNNLTLKCDVYSFGVVLLEIVSGKRNRTVPAFLPDAWESWNQREIGDLLDPEVAEPEAAELSLQLIRCIQIGLLCVQLSPADRPAMSQVVAMLTSTSSAIPMPTKPTVSSGARPGAQLISPDRPGPSWAF